MTELIKLFNKDFFPNLKDALNEASGLNGDALQLPDNENLGTITSATDGEWNTLFKKYLDFNLELYTIAVKGFERKTPINGEPTDGFIKLIGETAQEQGRRKFFIVGKRQTQDVVKADQITIVTNEAEATLFKKEDLNTIVDAIKRVNEFNLKNTRFEFKKATSQSNVNANYPLAIMKTYFGRLCGNESLGNTLNAASNVLMNICRKRQNPLVGNPLFDALKAIMTNPDHSFEVSPQSIITLNNILADRILTVNEIINPKNMLGSLTYNRNLYRLHVEQIKDLFEIYWKAMDIDVNKITNPALDMFKTDDGKKLLQKNLMVKTGDDDADVFRSAVAGKQEDADAFPKIGWKPEGDLVRNFIVRSPAEAQGLLNAILGTEEHEEDTKNASSLFLQLLSNGDVEVISPSTYTEADDDVSATFNNVEFKKGMSIRIVKTYKTSQKDITKANLLIPLAKKIASDPELSKVITVDRTAFICKEDFVTSVSVKGGTNSSRQFVLRSFDFTTIALDNDEKPTEEEKPEEEGTEGEAQTEPTVTTTEVKPDETFAGKTIQDISKMNKDEWNSFKGNLTDEDKVKLKALGGKLLAVK